MSTIQMIGIGIAVGILIILVIALVITKRREAAGGGTTKEKKTSKREARKEAKLPEAPPPDLTPDTASVFEGAPRSDLHMLGGKEATAPAPAADAGPGAAAAAGAVAVGAAAAEAATAGGGEQSGNDLWGHSATEAVVPGATADLWGSAAATADAEVAATQAPAEPASGVLPTGASAAADLNSEAVTSVPMFADVQPSPDTREPVLEPAAPEPGDRDVAPADVAFSAWAVGSGAEPTVQGIAVDESVQEPAETPVAPYSTEPPPPWEQEALAAMVADAADTTPEDRLADAAAIGAGVATPEPLGGAPENRVVAAPWIIEPGERPFAESAEKPFSPDATADLLSRTEGIEAAGAPEPAPAVSELGPANESPAAFAAPRPATGPALSELGVPAELEPPSETTSGPWLAHGAPAPEPREVAAPERAPAAPEAGSPTGWLAAGAAVETGSPEPPVAAPPDGPPAQAPAEPVIAAPTAAEPAIAEASLSEPETLKPSHAGPAAVSPTTEEPAIGPQVRPASAVPAEPVGSAAAGATPAGATPAGATPAGATPAEPRSPKLVALSSIISTTNQQMVDLNDPEVRRMLKELAKSEIDLAQQYKSLGQDIDATLQLTEAKKICESLDMASHARLIDQMIAELQP